MKLNAEQPKIIVVGSSSVDIVLMTDRLPKDNETLVAENIENYFGGKGANQAVGTARLGASTYFVGCVGMDPMGQQIMRHLVEENINVGFVAETEKAATGSAYFTRDSKSFTGIVLPEANHCLTTKHINEAEHLFETADFVLLQLEIPEEAVKHTLKLALKYNVKVGLYASPAKKLSYEMLDNTEFTVMKKADIPICFEGVSGEELLKKYPNQLFLREEDNATVYYNGSEMIYRKHSESNQPYKLGMGDAFVSGFTIALCHGNSIEEAVDFGNDVAGKVAKLGGSQQNLPYLEDYLK